MDGGVRHAKPPEQEDTRGQIPHYIKLRDDSKIFTSLMSLAKSRNQRERHRKILLEGRRLIRDALEVGVEAEAIFFTQDENLDDLDLSNVPNLKLYKLTYKQLSLWSDLTTPPGIIGIFHLPRSEDLRVDRSDALPLTVICDGIREPGNLGAILRCAAAVGSKQILLTKGCVDLWDPKVLRGACGAHFRAAIESNVGWDSVCNFVARDAAVYLAAANDDEDDGDGDSGNDRYLPLRRYQLDKSGCVTGLLEDGDRGELNEELTSYEVDESGRKVRPIYEAEDEEFGRQSRRPAPIAARPYHEVDYSKDKELAVIVGGETTGVSKAARLYAHDSMGESIYIPMQNDIESLNASVALGVILYEIQRQFHVAARSRRVIADPS